MEIDTQQNVRDSNDRIGDDKGSNKMKETMMVTVTKTTVAMEMMVATETMTVVTTRWR